MTRSLGLALLLLVALTDIISALIYSHTGHELADSLRYVRDSMTFVLAIVGLIRGGLPTSIHVTSGIYMTFIFCYLMAGLGSSPGLLVASSGRLILPVLFLYAGAAALRDIRAMRIYVLVMMVLAGLSCLFGMWEIEHTEFWEEFVRYGEYLYDLKGIQTGYHPEYMLPWNFFRETDIRRAAGLMAAPLAQGSFIATASMLGFAAMRARRLRLGVAILLVAAFGILESGTRGAMLMLIIAMSCFLVLTMNRTLKRSWDTILITAGVLLAAEILSVMVISTITLDDSSGIGHLDALIDNITNLGPVLVIGGGLGAAGPDASLYGYSILGGGEGTLFSIIYQIGLPGGIAFLIFYGTIIMHTLVTPGRDAEVRNMTLGVGAFAIGAASSLILSEHLLTVSGMAAFWMAAGGALILCEQERVRVGK